MNSYRRYSIPAILVVQQQISVKLSYNSVLIIETSFLSGSLKESCRTSHGSSGIAVLNISLCG